MTQGAPKKCPDCGSTGPFSRPRYHGERGRGIGMFLVGGLWAWLLQDTSREEEWQCDECSVIFRMPGGTSRRIPWLVVAAPFLLIPVLGLIVLLLAGVFGDSFAKLISNENGIKLATTLIALAAGALIVVIRLLRSPDNE